jgi:hypothetical protein
MIRVMISGILVPLILGCTGVSNYQHLSSFDDGKLFVHRVPGFNACGSGAVFYIDDQNILKLGTKEFAEIPVSTGPHKISVKADQTFQKDEVNIEVPPNGLLYYRIEPNPERIGPTLLVPIVTIETN